MNSDYYVLLNNEHSLWCSRSDGSFTPKTGKSHTKKKKFCYFSFTLYLLKILMEHKTVLLNSEENNES